MDKWLESSSSTIAAIKEALIPVAQKIGEGAEYAWTVVVTQQYVKGIGGLIVSSVIMTGMIAFGIYLLRWAKKSEEESVIATTTVYWIIMMLSLAIGMIPWWYSSLLHLLNPDYYALEFFMTLGKSVTK